MNKKLFERINNNVHRGEDISIDIPDFDGEYFKVINIFSISRDFVKEKVLRSKDELGEFVFDIRFSLTNNELEFLTELYEYHINMDSIEYKFGLITSLNATNLRLKYFAFKNIKKEKKYGNV